MPVRCHAARSQSQPLLHPDPQQKHTHDLHKLSRRSSFCNLRLPFLLLGPTETPNDRRMCFSASELSNQVSHLFTLMLTSM